MLECFVIINFVLLKFVVGFKMGKRSTNTTKSGKFMNPTDQASKLKNMFCLLVIIIEALIKGKIATLNLHFLFYRKRGPKARAEKE